MQHLFIFKKPQNNVNKANPDWILMATYQRNHSVNEWLNPFIKV